MRWPDEIRAPEFAFLDEDITVRPQELKMAEALIASMTGEFDPSEFTDDYREAMTALLEAKQTGGEVQPVPETADPGAAVVDLMSALRRSVERARGGAADDEDEAPAPARRARTAEAPARTAPARKAPAKRAPAKKAAAGGAAAQEEAPARTRARKVTAAPKQPAKEPAKRASRRSA
jgi:DNA end-binding protein Ku